MSRQQFQKITALYIRVSTDFQAEEGYSIEAQQQKLQKWCELHDITNYKFYIDGGWSGSNLNRPYIQELITDIKIGKIQTVVVYKLDRISRSQKDTLYLLEDIFIPNDVSFVSLNENFDTSTPYGRLSIGIMSAFAQLERENIKERTQMGKYQRVKSGLFPGGGGVPFGYDYDANKNLLVPNEHAEEVKAIYDLYLKGYSPYQLAEMFPVNSDVHISKILGRNTYLGKISYKGEVFNGQHKAIIDEETWNKVQAERERRSTKGVTNSQYLLSGFLVCGKCGAKMRYQKWGKGLKIYCYSQQNSKKKLIKDPNCNNARYNAIDVETIILEDLFAMTDHITAQETTQLPDWSQNSIKNLEQKRDSLKTKIRRLYNLYAESEDELLLETIEANQKELASIMRVLDDEIESQKTISQTNYDLTEVKNLRNRWNTMTIQEKRRAIRICIDHITLTDEAVDIQYRL